MKSSIFQPAVLLLIIISINGCTDHKIKKEETGEYDFAFGSFYGECGGEQCIEFFKVTQGKLFENTSDQYPLNQQEKYTFNDVVELSQQNYELVKDLRDKIPAALFNEEQTVLGCPDCSDGGGMYIEVIMNGQSRYWYIDAMTTEHSLQNFTESMKEKIRLLNL
jgi:hypothetical protein